MYNAELKLKQDGTLSWAGLQLGWPHQIRAVTPVPCPVPRVSWTVRTESCMPPSTLECFSHQMQILLILKSSFRSCFPCEVPSTLWLISFLGRINLFSLRLHQSSYCEDATLYKSHTQSEYSLPSLPDFNFPKNREY